MDDMIHYNIGLSSDEFSPELLKEFLLCSWGNCNPYCNEGTVLEEYKPDAEVEGGYTDDRPNVFNNLQVVQMATYLFPGVVIYESRESCHPEEGEYTRDEDIIFEQWDVLIGKRHYSKTEKDNIVKDTGWSDALKADRKDLIVLYKKAKDEGCAKLAGYIIKAIGENGRLLDLADKRVCLVGFESDALKSFIKSMGGNPVKAANKQTDIFINNELAITQSKQFDQMCYQTDHNGKLLLSFENFISSLEADGVEIPEEVRTADILFPETTKEEIFAGIESAAKTEKNYYFNPDFEFLKAYSIDCNEEIKCKVKFDDEVTAFLIHNGIDEKKLARFNGKNEFDVYALFDICQEDLYKFFVLCMSVRFFCDFYFKVNVRIYRDRFEEKGDYPTMSYPNKCPLALYWTMNNKLCRFGYAATQKQ